MSTSFLLFVLSRFQKLRRSSYYLKIRKDFIEGNRNNTGHKIMLNKLSIIIAQ